MFYDNVPVVQGEGGGGKKSGGGKVTANNLQSLARARFVELISEGEIVGLVNGARSIFFNQTPLQNADGSFNFDNVTWQQRRGLPDDEHLKGHQAVEQVTSVETEVAVSTGSVVRTIVQPNADAVRVIIRLNALFTTDDKGNINNHSVSYNIDMRPSGGTWATMVAQNISNRKSSSPVQIAHRIELPPGHTSWEIRVSRTSPDDTVEKNQSTISWESYVTLVEGRFTYPHSALVAMEVNAEDLGGQIPPRAFEVKGLRINIPTNYNPETRVYTGIWNGSFKTQWTNNPAWIFYDLIVNNRYGLGEFVNVNEIDKWGLYQIGQYCDGMVPSGFKTPLGADIMEPRFTFNGIISSREEAYFALQKITTAFRGMGYWAIGQYFATADMPEDPVLVVAPANVIGGKFTYSSTAMKARHNVALVRWNDPQDFYRPATELVIDEASLQKNGWREKRLDFLGCTSRGLARRYGKWVLDTENNETETVEYQASFDHANLRPGHIIAITDPRKASMRMGGRIVSHVGNVVTLDQDFTLTGGVTYQIYLTMPDGQLALANVVNRPGPGQLTIAALGQQAMPGSVFVISASNLRPKTYRVLTVKEVSENIFSVSAMEHDPNKFARVEQNLVLEDIPYAVERVSQPPTALSAIQNTYLQDGSVRTRLVVSWSPPAGTVVRSYVISILGPIDNASPYAVTQQNSIDINDLDPGTYTIRITTVNRIGQSSSPAQITVVVTGSVTLANFLVTNLENLDNPGSLIFRGDSPSIRWVNNFPVAEDSTQIVTTSPMYDYNRVRIYDAPTSTLLRTVNVVGNSFTYGIDLNRQDSLTAGLNGARRNLRFDVDIKDINGTFSPVATISLNNPAPAALTPAISVELASAYVSWSAIDDEDFRGVRAWIQPTPSFDPLVTIPTFDGPGGAFTYKGNPGSTVYLRIGAYDAFSKSDMTISGPFTISLGTISEYLVEINEYVDGVISESLDAINAYDADMDILYAAQEVFGDLAGVTNELTTASITSEALTRATEIGSIAARIDTVEATADELTATVTTQATAIADLEDNALALLSFRVKAGSAGAQLELIAQSNPEGSVSLARISADDIILDGTVTAEKLNVTELSAVSATLGTFQSAASGERIVIATDRILVYDASNVLRVRIGNLS